MTTREIEAADVEFWRLSTVLQKVGLSKTEIYRRQAAGTFPRSRRYRNSSSTYWRSDEIRTWQQEEIVADLSLDEVGLLG